MFHSNISYCNIIWGFNYKSSLKIIQTFQNKAIRLLSTNQNNLQSSKELYQKYKVLELVNINKFQIAVFTYKYLNQLLPISFYSSNYFTYSNVQSYKTRNEHTLIIPFTYINIRLFSAHLIDA